MGPARAAGAIPLETKSCISGDPEEGRQLPQEPAGPEWGHKEDPAPNRVAAARPGPSGNGPLGLKSYRLNLETALTECLLFRRLRGQEEGECARAGRVGGGERGGQKALEVTGSWGESQVPLARHTHLRILSLQVWDTTCLVESRGQQQGTHTTWTLESATNKCPCLSYRGDRLTP